MGASGVGDKGWNKTWQKSETRRVARRIRTQHLEVVDVRVIGSITRGDQVGTSDVDVLIVLEHGESEDPIEQTQRSYPYFDLPIGVDLLVLTRDR